MYFGAGKLSIPVYCSGGGGRVRLDGTKVLREGQADY